jgi:hypothetical protein
MLGHKGSKDLVRHRAGFAARETLVMTEYIARKGFKKQPLAGICRGLVCYIEKHYSI